LHVLIRRRQGFLQLSADGTNPLPVEVRLPIERMLTYTYVEYLRGRPVYDPQTGEQIRVLTDPRALFTYDVAGLLLCQKGYLPRLSQYLSQQGHEIEIESLDEPFPPEVYQEDWENVYRLFKFRPQQDVCLAQIAAHDCGVIDAVTAFGKMWIIAMVCALYPKARIDIVVKPSSVARKMLKLLTEYIPNVGLVGDGSSKRGRVTIYMADSLHRSDGNAHIVLADECHMLCTDNYVEKLARYARARMYGFTASKETRGDNLHERLEGMFGPTIFFIDYPTAQALGLVSPIVVQWHDVNMDVNPVASVRDDVERKRRGIWQNDHRNSVIANAVRPLVLDNQQILIAVETVEHACFLKRHLPTFELCYNENSMEEDRLRYFIQAGFLSPTEPLMTPARRQWMQDAFEDRRLLHVIATTVWSVGVSFDSLQVQVRAEGSRSETKSIQVPGRVCRVAAGKEYGVVQDFMDNFDRGFRNASLERQRVYSTQQWQHVDAAWQPLFQEEAGHTRRRRRRGI
jgi:superfamily II DNA or RNA helicase